jgi:carbamoyltransferase
MITPTERIFGAFYPTDDIGDRRLPDNTSYLEQNNIWRSGSQRAVELGRRFQARLDAGETLHLLGFLGTAHNSGVAVVEASRARGVVILANYEEERFSGAKHFSGYPAGSVAEVKRFLTRRGVSPSEIFGVFYAFDTVCEEQAGMRMRLVNNAVVKNSQFKLYTDAVAPAIELAESEIKQARQNLFSHSPAAVSVFRNLVQDLGLPAATPCIQMLHHESHAYAAFGASPFAAQGDQDKPTMIACVDGGGDLGSISLFVARRGRIELVRRGSRVNSLGAFYLICAMLLGGWTALGPEADPRSDNRYMGVAAFGNHDRLTNPYYRRLQSFFHFGADGEVFVNKVMAENSFAGLEAAVGPFFMVLGDRDRSAGTDDDPRFELTSARADIAAAVQLVFEDVLFHIVGGLIAQTGSDQLVLCGGAALNPAANMRLLEHFDDRFYRATPGADTRLKLWIPPFAADQGSVVGAPYQFAMCNGARPAEPLPSPFLCGLAPESDDIDQALRESDFVNWTELGYIDDEHVRQELAYTLAGLVSQDAAVGLFHGEAETGGRALGRRTILANPCNPQTPELVNSRVKLRERLRPLSAMMTLEAAAAWFDLAPGAASRDYDAYDYMVIAARAKPEARAVIPAVIGPDGLCRIQIVRRRSNALVHDYLKALRAAIGIEVSVNTSLNVRGAIVQTPGQALDTLRRSKGLDGVVMIGADGAAKLVWPKPHLRAFNSAISNLSARRQPAAMSLAPPPPSRGAPVLITL